MDLKNTLAAVSLSAAVIILYGLFFAPSPQEIKEERLEKERNELVQNEDAPKLLESDEIKVITRESAIKESERVVFENENIIGSISLKGASIDDLTFKNYKVNLNNDKKVTLLGPKNLNEGYFVESGFVTTDKNIDIPNSNTVWSVNGNNKLTNQTPIKLLLLKLQEG